MMRQLFSKIFLIFLLQIVLFVEFILPQNLTVIHADGSISTNLPTEKLNHNIRYVSINDFANLFKAHIYFNVQNKKVIVNFGERTIEVTAFNPFFSIDNVIYQLPLKTEYKDQKVYLPLSFFLSIIDRVFENQLEYDSKNEILKIIDPLYGNVTSINSIQIDQKANGTLIKINTAKNFSLSDLSLNARHLWLYLDLYGGRIDSSILYSEYSEGLIARIIPRQISNELAQLSFRLREEIIEKQIYLDNPLEILISLRTQKDLSQDISKSLETEKKKWRIDKIVIDPGHGGRDSGAIGPNNTYEKNVVLAVSQLLKQVIEEQTNIEVLMTRKDDRFIGLKKRTDFANENQAKLFISIHANSNRSRWVRGVSTYFLGPENTEEAREVAWLENSVIKYENGSKYADLSAENFILSAMAQNIYNAESQDLAVMAQQEIIKESNFQDAGVRQAGFHVLLGASMPNILIEIGFISNPEEEKLLKEKSYQQKIATGIFNCIKRFKEKYEIEI